MDSRGASGLGLYHLLGPERASLRLTKPGKVDPSESRRRRQRGKRGEREVVHLWRANGWTGAYRQPGSGALRREGEPPPLPGDIGGVWPWLVEVKFDVRSSRPSRGWTGEAFIRSTLRRLTSTWRVTLVTGGEVMKPVLFVRSDAAHGERVKDAWRVFVPSLLFRLTFNLPPILEEEAMRDWVEISVPMFFAEFASPPRNR